MTSEDDSSGQTVKRRISIIHDGDHGGDDFITTLMALGRPDIIDLLGITTCHGNIPVEVATQNACLATDYKPGANVLVYEGASKPWKIDSKQGDNAFGENGLGGVEIPDPITQPSEIPAFEWLKQILQEASSPITICATGPMTNLALLIDAAPELKSKIESIVVMGGCLSPIGPKGLQGNITPFAEFNFYMDPDAADFVLNCGVKVILFPMDLTHQFVFTSPRQVMAAERLGDGLGEKIIQIMRAVEDLDQPSFDLEGAVFHDENVLLYLLDPDLYRGKWMNLRVVTDSESERHGQLVIDHEASTEAKVYLVDRLLNSDRAFELMLDAFAPLIRRSE
ncbi:MAG: nucleoside hydrolase [Verrucomicrobia bacterium]|nr:nucleoside hydrolase [Verrucomicrobiota bacterium]